jgi:hypothetical protein
VVALLDIGFVAQQAAALTLGSLCQPDYGLIVVYFAPVPNIARRAEGANMGILRSVLSGGKTEIGLGKARLAALRPLRNV